MAIQMKFNGGAENDCVFYKKYCTALRAHCADMKRRPGGCPFHKTKAEYDEQRKACNKRLSELPEREQFTISWTYFDGQRPWLCEEE